MSFYSYTAIDVTGRQTSGTLESGSVDEAAREIAGKGFYLLTIQETSATLQKIKTFLASHQVNRMEIIEFAQSLSVMLKAGMPILGCLEDLVASTSNKIMKSAIRDIKKRVEHGSSVSTAIAAQGAIFPGYRQDTSLSRRRDRAFLTRVSRRRQITSSGCRTWPMQLKKR